MMNFCMVLHQLQNPKNVGTIVRSHAAFGGDKIILTGHELPWRFKKGSQAFSRKLEKRATMKHIPNIVDAVKILRKEGYDIIALEIREHPQFIHQYQFQKPPAFICGNEGKGLLLSIQHLCDRVLTIPQYADVGSLNVGVAASIAMYEFMHQCGKTVSINGHKFGEHPV